MIRQEFGTLQDVNEIGVTSFTLATILKFKSSPKLLSCFKGLVMKSLGLLSFDVSCSIMGRMENLEIIVIGDYDSFEGIKFCFEEMEYGRICF